MIAHGMQVVHQLLLQIHEKRNVMTEYCVGDD